MANGRHSQFDVSKLSNRLPERAGERVQRARSEKKIAQQKSQSNKKMHSTQNSREVAFKTNRFAAKMNKKKSRKKTARKPSTCFLWVFSSSSSLGAAACVFRCRRVRWNAWIFIFPFRLRHWNDNRIHVLCQSMHSIIVRYCGDGGQQQCSDELAYGTSNWIWMFDPFWRFGDFRFARNARSVWWFRCRWDNRSISSNRPQGCRSSRHGRNVNVRLSIATLIRKQSKTDQIQFECRPLDEFRN